MQKRSQFLFFHLESKKRSDNRSDDLSTTHKESASFDSRRRGN